MTLPATQVAPAPRESLLNSRAAQLRRENGVERCLTNVLVVEDTETDAELIQVHLRSSGQYAVSCVETLAGACEFLRDDDKPDCVVLDLNLPDSAGIATFTALRDQFPETPIIILSGHEDEEMATNAVAEGAQDYIPKSSLDGPLVVRAVQYAIERNARQLAERRNELMLRDFNTARRVQQHLLNIQLPQIEGFDITAVCRPAEATGGDFFDIVQTQKRPRGILDKLETHQADANGKNIAGCDLVIADVCGHGLGPALTMVGTRRTLRTCALMCDGIDEILTIANQAVSEDSLTGKFVSVFYGRLDSDTRTLMYSSAGHPSWVIETTGQVKTLESTRGVPLGILADSVYSVDGSVRLNSGDILVLMTDGVWETTGPDGAQFGVTRVFELIHQHREQTAAEIREVLLSEVLRFCQPHLPEDDVTLVLVKALE